MSIIQRQGKEITFIPTIDISKGRSVLVKQGKVVEDNGDPLERAKLLSIHNNFQVVDLDRAMGIGDNKQIIFTICQSYTCYVAGGIKTFEDAAEYLNRSAKRVVISTMASPELLSKIPTDRTIIAFDIDENYCIFKKGRLELCKETLFDKLLQLKNYLSVISITFHFTEGCNSGIPKQHIEKIQEFLSANKISAKVAVAGGISSISDISYLISKGVTPQFGAGFYKGNFTLGEVFKCYMNEEKQIKSFSLNKQALYPAIILTSIGTISSLAYMTSDQIKTSVDTHKLHYYETKNKELVLSDKSPLIIQLVSNCDQTSIVTVLDSSEIVQCEFDFDDPTKGSMMFLEQVVKCRMATDDKQSYTKQIFGKLNYLACKIIEESTELWNSSCKINVQNELADLLYFLVVYAMSYGITMKEINNELIRRHFEITRRNIAMLKKPTDLKLGICNAEFSDDTIETLLKEYGILAHRDTTSGPKCLKYNCSFLKHPETTLIATVVKPRDIYTLMQMGYIDFALCLKQHLENYPVDFVDITPKTKSEVKEYVHSIVIVGKQGIDLAKVNYKYNIFSEYSFFTNKWADEKGIKAKVTPLSGNCLEFLVNGLCDMCCCELPNQKILDDNHLEVVAQIYQSKLGLFCRKEAEANLKHILDI